MRHTITIMIYVVLLSLGLLIQSTEAKKPSVQYLKLFHQPHFSPDGRHNVVITEDRYPGGSLYSLMLWTMDEEGFRSHNRYDLTPEYKEFVAMPDGKIGFVKFETGNRYTIQAYDPKTGKMSHPWEGASIKMKHLQFSKDMRAYCVFMDKTPHRFATLKTKIERTLTRSGWYIYSKDHPDGVRSKSGDIYIPKKEKEIFTEWAPIEKPKKIPALLAQPMPKITLETQIQWSPDSIYVYVLDRTGIWRLEPDIPGIIKWTKVISVPNIKRFHISPTGTALLYEIVPDKHAEKKYDFLVKDDEIIRSYKLDDPYGLMHEIWLVDLKKINIRKEALAALSQMDDMEPEPRWLLDATALLTPRKLLIGWGAAFNPLGKSISYNTFWGGYLLNLETLETEMFYSTSFKYD